MLIDTHVAIWMLQDSPRISKRAREVIDQEIKASRALSVSAISIAEIIYLVERGRIEPEIFHRLVAAIRDPDSGLKAVPLDAATAAAATLVNRDAVPDFPDRLIAATSLVLKEQLITADRKIQKALPDHIW